MLQNHSITYFSFGEQFLPKPNITSSKFQAFHISCLLLYRVWSSLVDPCWEIYHTPKIKITYTLHMCAASTLEVRKNMLFIHLKMFCSYTRRRQKNMFARFYHNKCSKFLIIFLSKVVVKRNGSCKNIKRWTQKRSKVKKKKGKKEKEMRIKITHVLAKIFHKGEIYFREHSKIRLATKYSTHMHILIYEYDTSLLGSGVWL